MFHVISSSCNMSGRIGTRNRSEGDLVIDNVLSTQSELGPTIPDGGYGWIVFLVTLFFQTHPDDEEDIFSKNSRELQISVQSQHGAQIRTEELSGTQSNDEHHGHNEEGKNEQRANIENQATKNWETFDDDGEETTKYQRVENWDETTEPAGVADETIADKQYKQWQTFEDEPGSRNNKNLQLEMSFGTTREPSESRPAMDATTITHTPMPLYSDSLPNNSNFSYDLAEDGPDASKFSIFVPIPVNSGTNHSFIVDIRSALELLREPTFYKSFLTVMTTKWSLFVFFSLYPSFLFQEVKEIRLSHLANLVGTISLATFLFSAVAYWINIEKKWRPKTIWILSWIGAIGYFNYVSEGLLIFGAVQIVLSIAALEHVATPLLCMTVKGEATKEFTLICLLTGITLLFFVLVDSSLKQIFRMMALLNFLTGCMWLANYIYKRLFK
ncbi:hypothetical protein YQE_11320, partial [Dendroctonus ponderosae]